MKSQDNFDLGVFLLGTRTTYESNIDWSEQREAYVDDLLVGVVAGGSVDHSSVYLHSQVGVQLARHWVQEAVRGGHHEALVPDGRTAETGKRLWFVTQ